MGDTANGSWGSRELGQHIEQQRVRQGRDAQTTLEHARAHCVQMMPLHTQRQARAYLFAMEDFQRAFWEIVRDGR